MVQKKRLLVGAAALAIGSAITGASVYAFAGYQWSDGVTIAPGQFYGTIGAVHNKPNGQEMIGCSVRGNSVGMFGTCEARDAQGTAVSCSASAADAPHVVEAMKVAAGAGDARLVVMFTSGRCTDVAVYNYSSYPAKR
jgi:hypothetical protein